MPNQLHPSSDRDAVLRFLGSEYVTTLCDGRIVVIGTHLDGSAVCAMARLDGVVYVVVDFEKPGCFAHARAMIRGQLGDVEGDDDFPLEQVEMIVN